MYISATSSVAVGLLLAAVQVDVVGLGPRLRARGGTLPLPLGQVLAVRQVPVVVADGCGSSERGVTQPDQCNLVCLGSSAELRHWRRSEPWEPSLLFEIYFILLEITQISDDHLFEIFCFHKPIISIMALQRQTVL